MENQTIRNLRTEIAETSRLIDLKKKEYKDFRRLNPWESTLLAERQSDIRKLCSKLMQQRLELESYQLEFLFGA